MRFGSVLVLMGLAACGRTPIEGEGCVGPGCPCVYDFDCGEGALCLDGLCLDAEDFRRCIEEGPQPETCNGRDDDCNGAVDDGVGTRTCSAASGLGTCPGEAVCGGVAGWICDAIPPRAELCDGRDDDCDGTVDEDFVDAEGRYASTQHCGACNRDCVALIEGALEAACVDGATCRVSRCRGAQVPLDDGQRCGTPVTSLCQACSLDAQCSAGGACLSLDDGSRACGQGCAPGDPLGTTCPSGFECSAGQCTPSSGSCACGPATVGVTRGCDTALGCGGTETCRAVGGGFGWGPCELGTVTETCDGMDDDCDGEVDEDFLDGRGRYVLDTHCGSCNQDCTRQWSEAIHHATGACDASGVDPVCRIAVCSTEQIGATRYEWVDLDGLAANGCECRRRQGNLNADAPDDPAAPNPTYEDENCDGVDGVAARAVFVWAGASAVGDGSRAAPFSNLTQAVIRAREVSAAYVLVAEGSYGSVNLENGDILHGGYSGDFRSRDPERFRAVLGPLVAESVRTALVAGFEIRGVPGQPAVTVRDGGPGFSLRGNRLVAADGRDGSNGSDGRPGFGRRDSLALDGGDGQDGRRVPGACQSGFRSSGGTAGSSGSCGVPGRPGGSAVCPVFDLDANPTIGSQANFRTGAPDGAGGFDWSFDRLSNPRCGHVTESGFPSAIQDNDGHDGLDGAQGTSGSDGVGCRVPFGTLIGGLQALPGSDGNGGGAGMPGGGGGSGGGTARFFRGGQDCFDHEIGGTGGGGGAPGCGGAAGRGGAGGQASVVIQIEASTPAALPTLVGNQLRRGRGGAGGRGGLGGDGGEGGRGGFGGQPTSWSGAQGGKGGDGGNGGRGGVGGSGCGGPSVGILVLGTLGSAYEAANPFERPAATELGGPGGAGSAQTEGADGATARVLELTPCPCGLGLECRGGFCLP